jgi:hypothetical protein
MSRSGGWSGGLSYLGRLIVGTLREWWHLWALSREMGALVDRREDLLLRLGKRYHQFIAENRAEPVPAVAELVADLRVVLQRIMALSDIRRQIKQETYLYFHPELAAPPPAWASDQPLADRPIVSGAPPITRPSTRPGPPQASIGGSFDLIDQLAPRRAVPGPPAAPVCECGQPLPAGARFCPACGKAQGAVTQVSPEIAPPRKCSYCGAELPLGAEFCPSCGGHVDADVYEM